MDFKCLHWREKKAQSFNKEEIFLEKAGKKFNMYDFIQAGRDDTEVIPTLEKYGCIDKMMLNVPDVYGDFTAIKDLRSIKEQEIRANQMWENLPLETRQAFNNDKYNFMENGENWLKNKLDELKAQEPKAEQQELFNNEEQNNG